LITLSYGKGINNVSNKNRLPDGFLRECVDFDVNNNGMVMQRGSLFVYWW